MYVVNTKKTKYYKTGMISSNISLALVGKQPQKKHSNLLNMEISADTRSDETVILYNDSLVYRVDVYA